MTMTSMVRWTIKHDINEYSAAAHAAFGFLKMRFGAYEEGVRYGDLGIKLLSISHQRRRCMMTSACLHGVL